MPVAPDILETLDKGKPLHMVPVGGGCIADARCAEFADGSRVFIKTAAGPADMFPAEAEGLRALTAAAAIRVPQVLAASSEGLALEWIESGTRAAGFSETFGRQFAGLHQCRGKHYGFNQNNYIGATRQINSTDKNEWSEFFMHHRLRFQAELAERKGHGPELLQLLDSAERVLIERMSEAPELPSLLHGDLWSGNFMVDERGDPVLIDPACYFGHREADLAMTRWFGGFDAEFYAAYDEAFPLEPGTRERQEIYRLYHVLNHLNLFGTGYYGQALAILRPYSSR